MHYKYEQEGFEKFMKMMNKNLLDENKKGLFNMNEFEQIASIV